MGKSLHQSVHVSRLKPYHSPDEPTTEPLANEVDASFDPHDEEALQPLPEDDEAAFDEELDQPSSPSSSSQQEHDLDIMPSSPQTRDDTHSEVSSSATSGSAPPQHQHSLRKRPQKGTVSSSNDIVPDQPHITKANATWPQEVLPEIDLPAGWRVESKTRKTGKSAGTVDFYYYDPNGKRYRSQVEVQRALGLIK
jgi:hypothetical protein